MKSTSSAGFFLTSTSVTLNILLMISSCGEFISKPTKILLFVIFRWLTCKNGKK